MIFQHYNLVNRLSVLENVLHGCLGYKNTIQGILGLYSEQEKREAVRILEMLGLEVQMYKRCDQLSGGQKQWVGIARALVQQPRMLLCDESIASLDPSSAKIIIDTLREINRTWGITVLVNLDQVDVALHYAERIIGINRGKILYDGGPQALSNAQICQIYGSEASELILDRSYAVEIWVERGWAKEARIASRTMAAVAAHHDRPGRRRCMSRRRRCMSRRRKARSATPL